MASGLRLRPWPPPQPPREPSRLARLAARCRRWTRANCQSSSALTTAASLRPSPRSARRRRRPRLPSSSAPSSGAPSRASHLRRRHGLSRALAYRKGGRPVRVACRAFRMLWLLRDSNFECRRYSLDKVEVRRLCQCLHSRCRPCKPCKQVEDSLVRYRPPGYHYLYKPGADKFRLA